MQPLASAMTKVGKALVAALKSLLRGRKMLIQAILAALWLTPSEGGEHSSSSSASSSDPTSARPNGKCSTKRQRSQQQRQNQKIEAFLKEAESLLLGPVDNTDALRRLASKLKAQFRERMQSNTACMLPSYNSQLPTGYECGQYLSLDVGGSTLRVALVELRGRMKGRDGRRQSDGPDDKTWDEEEDEVSSRIVRMRSFHISPEIKALEGLAFFDWMAKRIFETIQEDIPRDHSPDSPILMGLAWSFPLQQLSLKSGLLQPMGKGFLASSGLVNQDLGDLISFACQKQGLSVELRAIINDSSATLLSQAYLAPQATRFGLILGTGFNIAAHVPCSCVGREKFGNRSAEWFERDSHVVVNTEMGMFGHGILPLTRWDDKLNEKHPKPDFQPLEHLVSGMYLGEVARIVLVEAIECTGLLGGVVPEGLNKDYGFDTETMSFIEGDSSPTLESATAHFNLTHPSSVPATTADMLAIRSLCGYISRRSAAMVAAAVYALWDLRKEAEVALLTPQADSSSSSPTTPPVTPPSQRPDTSVVDPISHLPSPPASSTILSSASPATTKSAARAVVAYNGSVIERYPSYLPTCQAFLRSLVTNEASGNDLAPSSKSGSGGEEVMIDLVEAKESSLLGAAVALASA